MSIRHRLLRGLLGEVSQSLFRTLLLLSGLFEIAVGERLRRLLTPLFRLLSGGLSGTRFRGVALRLRVRLIGFRIGGIVLRCRVGRLRALREVVDSLVDRGLFAFQLLGGLLAFVGVVRLVCFGRFVGEFLLIIGQIASGLGER